MKLTPRERTMLIFLGIIAVLAASYFFLLKPQLEKIELLTAEEAAVQQQVDAVKQGIGSIDKLKASFSEQDVKIQESS